MHIEMRRVFHPVGQGAFYSESFYTGFGTFNMVYDCGSMSKGVDIDNIISKSFHKDNGDDIDILFISHFDSDHVNKITFLKESVNKIKKVIMPLIPDEDKGILLAFNIASNNITSNNIASNNEYQNYAKIISNPTDFFGKETKIIQVREREGGSPRENPEEAQATTNSNETRTSYIDSVDSGTNIHFHDSHDFAIPFWVYKPYNYKHKGRNRELIDKFKSKNISIEKLLDIEYINENIKDIRACYREIKGNINQNSLVLYSNYQDSLVLHSLVLHSNCLKINLCLSRCADYGAIFHRYDCWHCHRRIISPGCIYTGDVNLAKIRSDFKSGIIEEYRDHRPVGTIQVPHHGSKHGFDIGFFDDFKDSKCGIISPVSFGLSNPYRHPSSMVIEKLRENHFPVLVTNDGNSLIQRFIFQFNRLNKISSNP